MYLRHFHPIFCHLIPKNTIYHPKNTPKKSQSLKNVIRLICTFNYGLVRSFFGLADSYFKEVTVMLFVSKSL
nr:MAG TPA: hypothetical protein [Caudoviricetes sp.]